VPDVEPFESVAEGIGGYALQQEQQGSMTMARAFLISKGIIYPPALVWPTTSEDSTSNSRGERNPRVCPDVVGGCYLRYGCLPSARMRHVRASLSGQWAD
jgi:hypothetical protein